MPPLEREKIMRKQKFNHMLALVSTMTLAAGSHAVYAQQAAAQEAEEIVVTGFKASLEKAQEVKKASSSIVEAIAAEDIGKCAYGVFKNPQKFLGTKVGVAGEHFSAQQMVEAFSKALGEEVVYNKVSPEVYRSFGFPGAEDLGNMFQFYDEFEKHVNELRDVEISRQLNPELQSFEQWLVKNAKLVPL